MKIDINRLAKLARLRIEPEQEAGFQKDMNNILGMVENLPELSDSGALIDPQNPMQLREDISEQKYRRDDLLKNAPQTQAGCVVVPRVVE